MTKNLALPVFRDSPFQIRLSFHKIISHLTALSQHTDNRIPDELLVRVANHPELVSGITDIGQITENADLIAELTSGLFPSLLSSNEIKAISIPYQGLIFNYSERFRDILKDAGEDFEISIRDFDDHQFYVFNCCLILNRFYGEVVDFVNPLFCDIPAPGGYTRHYRVLYNADFLEILPLAEVPVLSAADVTRLLNNYDDLALWKEKFPREAWQLKGFAIMSLVDVTTENAVSQLKSDLLGSADDPDLHLKMEAVFRSVFKIRTVRIGFTSYDEVQGKFRNISFGQKIESFILANSNGEQLAKTLFSEAADKLISSQTYYTIADTAVFMASHPDSNVAKNFRAFNIGSIILAPIIKHGKVLGFLELVSPVANDFNSVNANRLENVMQFLTDTVERKIAEFRNRVQAVIQSNYTTLHPSVNWKFEREVYNLFKGAEAGEEYHLKEIRFRMVYPLYGQLDIQNSSVTRNEGVLSDLLNQLDLLNTIFGSAPPAAIKVPWLAARDWIDQARTALKTAFRSDAEQQIQKKLDTELYPLLVTAVKSSPSEIIDQYFRQTDPRTGDFFKSRRNYEETLNRINTKLVTILDQRHQEIQQFYPHYYERFKTDGVEHNLYIGSSIFPGMTFTRFDLERVRLWQLLVTAEMEGEQRKLKATLPYALGLTALILVYSSPISIRFRTDEKHFDLDAAYDIHYEIVKKRIDKAHIKGTTLRITGAEQLTVVYAKEEERNDYLKYLAILKRLGLVSGEIEELEIEDLQGISGLKALRVRLASLKEDVDHGGRYTQAYELLKADVAII